MKKLKDINWNHLYCFYEVARAQSLKSGAETVGVAPSTLSAQLKNLEKAFNTKLFNRSSKGLNLTTEGLSLFERAKAIFEEGSKILEHYSSDIVGGYSVTIGIEDTITFDLASEFSSQYWDFYTSYGVVNTARQLDHNQLLENLDNSVIDWGITLKRSNRKSIQSEEIGNFEIDFCCAPELFDKFKDVKDLLITIPFMMSNSDKNVNSAILKHLRKNGVIPKEKIYSDHNEYILNLVRRGRCVTFMSRNPLKKYSDIKLFNFGDALRINLYAVWKKEDEGLISIRKLKDLISSKLSVVPDRYKDIDLQIEVSDVSDEKLK